MDKKKLREDVTFRLLPRLGVVQVDPRLTTVGRAEGVKWPTATIIQAIADALLDAGFAVEVETSASHYAPAAHS